MSVGSYKLKTSTRKKYSLAKKFAKVLDYTLFSFLFVLHTSWNM